jgi:hypothetical protein
MKRSVANKFLRPAVFSLFCLFFLFSAASASFAAGDGWARETEKILAGLAASCGKTSGISPEDIASLGTPAYFCLLPRVTEESSYSMTFFADGMPRVIVRELSKAVPFGGVTLNFDDWGTDGYAKKTLIEASAFLPSRWLRQIVSNSGGRAISVRRSARGWYRRGMIVTNGLKTSLHELVHAYEDTPFPSLEQKLKTAFYEGRTRGKKLRNLSRITNFYFYGANEKFRAGFVWQYLGKEHGEELMSAGIECMLWNRFDIWNRDPELVKFLLGMIIFFGR